MGLFFISSNDKEAQAGRVYGKCSANPVSTYLHFWFLHLLFSIFHSCSSTPPDYYKKIKNNFSDGNLIGIYPIPDSDKSNTSGYHFTYDEKHRPIQIKYLKNGNISSNAPYLKIPIIKIDYSDGFKSRSYFDKYGNKIEIKGVHKIRIKINEKGHGTSVFHYDKEGNLTRN